MIIDEPAIRNLLTKPEGISLEFKTCRNQLNRDVFETVCAFLNRHGGTLLLGVNNAGDIVGVEPASVQQIKKDFANTINNPQKLNPPAYLSVDEAAIGEKIVLHVFIPESSQVHRCNGRIYDRNEDGDFDITDNTDLVANLYLRKQSSFTENKIYPFVEMKDLRADLIEKSRKIACVNTHGHPWGDMDDISLLQSAQLYQKEPQTGQQGFTLACIMLFGTDQVILSAVPAYRTDLILRKVNVDRYDDRDLVRTNLIDSYDRIVAFTRKHLPDPFYLEGIDRISLRDIIFREVASNLLIHREFTNAAPARLIIEYGVVKTENANRPHGFGALRLDNFAPYPKNPVIGAFFREIHRADELGSGMRKLMRYGKIYGGADPELIEGDIFRMIVKVPEFSSAQQLTDNDNNETNSQEPSRDQAGTKLAPSRHQVGTKSAPSRRQVEILRKCAAESSILDLMLILDRTNRTKFRRQVLKPLLEIGWLEMTIPDKPRSSNQKYRLTEAGRTVLKEYKV
jgi:ATP-dependent DNA helicase RecG